MTKRSAITRDLRSVKYRPRVVSNKKKTRNKRACRNKGRSMSEWPVHITVSAATFRKLLKILEKPPRPNKKLIELMRHRALWDTDDI